MTREPTLARTAAALVAFAALVWPARRLDAAPAATATAPAVAATASAAAAIAPPTLDGTTARALFTRFQGLAGSWRERSTKGWTGRTEYRVIARGSAVLAASSFDDEPGEGMATVVHLDGDRLLLTHYCEAGNQPRLVAVRSGDGGREVELALLDATNLPSPASGHMHRVVFHFLDADHFRQRWSWSQDGQERWMEDIEYERVPSGG